MQEAGGIGLARKRPVSAKNRIARKVPCEIEAFEDVPRGIERLVGEHRKRRAAAQLVEGLADALIRARVSEEPGVVQRQEPLERIWWRPNGGGREGARDER